MEIKILKSLLKYFSLFLIGYIFGNLIPFYYILPVIDKKGLEVETYQFYDFYIKIIAALVTFSAVVVALFREEIRRLFLYHKILIRPHSNSFLTEVISEQSTLITSDESIKSAEKYELILFATNEGKISAKECFVCVEEVKYKKTDIDDEKILEIFNIPLKWIGVVDSKITISKSAKVSFSGLLLTNEKKHEKGTKANRSDPLLLIGDTNLSKKYKSGIWYVTYVIYSADYEPHRYCLQVNWDGKWKPRLADLMEECISFKEVAK